MDSTNLELELNRICVSLESDNKRQRKQALDNVMKILFEGEEPRVGRELLEEAWKILNRPLTKLLNDQAEMCRDRSAEILTRFFDVLPPDVRHVVYVVPILSRRLSSEEYVEPSEEMRLKCVTLLRTILSKYKDFMPTYADDVVAILARTLTDKYPNAKKESCECVREFARFLPRQLYAHTEKFIDPILSNFKHQHHKVRVAAVETIGDVMRYGNGKFIERVTTPLAERLFDQSAAVRAAVIEVAGCWLVKLQDRYSWWHKIIPLVMTGLHDEVAELRVKAEELWDAAGRLYLKENENDEKLKDKMDYLTDKLEHYPPNVSRPNLGCRTIAQQNFYKLVNGMAFELGDWMADIRVRSAQLLCVFVLNVEQDVTQHIEKLLPAMYRACNDEDRRVVDNVVIAAEYIGYFVDPQIYCHLVLPTLEDAPSVGHLRTFAAILRGSERNSLYSQLEKIGDFLRQSHICRNRGSAYQKEMLSCCDSLFTVCDKDCTEISQQLYLVVFTTLSMATDEKISNEAKRLLSVLVKIESLPDIWSLHSAHLKSVLTTIDSNSKSWTIYNPEYYIFRTCLTYAKFTAAGFMDFVLPILEATTNENADTELRLKQLILLSEHFLSDRETLERVVDLRNFVNTVLERSVIPSLVWSAGRAAEAIRTAAVCCLCTLLRNSVTPTIAKDPTALVVPDGSDDTERLKVFTDAKDFSALFEKIIPILVTLADDNARKTRLYSLRAICIVMSIGQELSCVTEEHVHRTYPVLLKRLDDSCDDIRSASLEALVEVWATLPKDYNLSFSKSHVDALYTTLIIHLDDPEEHFQGIALDATMHLARIHPELLSQKLQNCRGNFRNQIGMDKLIDHCHDILSDK